VFCTFAMATVGCHCRFFFSPLPSFRRDDVVPTRKRSSVSPHTSSSLISAYSSSNQREGEKTSTIENDKTITSVSNPLVKHCVKLRLNSSYRRSNGSVLVVGLAPILYVFSCSSTTYCYQHVDLVFYSTFIYS
jgi:hypothetical protein